MKKSRMLLLFGGLFLLLVGYVAWCGRTFYFRAPMPDLAHVPVEARALVLDEINEEKLRRPEILTTRRFKNVLMSPYESDVPPINVELRGEKLIFVDRGYPWTGFVLARYGEGWRRVPENVKIPF